MLFPFSPALTDAFPELYTYTEQGLISYFVTYIIHSDFRTSVELKNWLASQMMDMEHHSMMIAALAEIPDKEDFDEQVLECKKWVQNNITYKGDPIAWKMLEYWQTLIETLQLRAGDCEDGAHLMYALCIFKGVPENRLKIMAGDVIGGGHCWLAYRP